MSGNSRGMAIAATLTCALLGAACGKEDAGSNNEIGTGVQRCTVGRWTSHGGNPGNLRQGCGETSITPDSVPNLAEKWRINPGSVIGTPAVYDGVVYFGSADRAVYAVDAETGDVIWSTPIEGAVQSSLAVSESSVYLVDLGPAGRVFGTPTPPQVYRLDRATGEILAQVDYDVHPLSVGWSSPVYIKDANLVVLGVASFEVFVSLGARTFHGKLLGLDGDTLDSRWVSEINAPEFGPGVSVWSSPAVDTELKQVYIGTGQGYEDPVTPMSDALVSVNYETGEHVWHQQYTADDKFVLNGPDNGPDLDVGAPPTLFDMADGTPAIGVGDKEGTFYVHDRRNGDVIWQEKITPGSTLGGVMQSAAFYEGEIFVISNKTNGGNPSLFCLDAENGGVVWDLDLGDIQVFGATTVINGVILFGDMDGRVHARSATDGSVLWDDPHTRATTAAQVDVEAIGAGISVVDGTVFVPFGAQAFPTGYFTTASSMLGGGVVAYHVP